MTRLAIALPCLEVHLTGMRTNRGYSFEKLDVYWLALEHYRVCKRILSTYGSITESDRDQYARAAKSIIRNICEGAGEFRRGEKSRLYRIALRSAEECGGIIRTFVEDLGERPLFNEADALLTRIIPMLIKLCKAKG